MDIYTPQEIAKRWKCTSKHVRELIADEKLIAFKVGKLYRVKGTAVEEFECKNTVSTSSVGNGQSSGKKGQLEGAIHSTPQTEKKRKPAPRLSTLHSQEQAAH